jgi:hypothetical protein
VLGAWLAGLKIRKPPLRQGALKGKKKEKGPQPLLQQDSHFTAKDPRPSQRSTIWLVYDLNKYDGACG